MGAQRVAHRRFPPGLTKRGYGPGMDFRRTTIADLAADVRSGRTRARDLVEVALARIEEVDQRVNAFVAVDADGAREQADAVDARVAAGEDVGPLAGIPLGVKDQIGRAHV